VPQPDRARWFNEHECVRHFRKHGALLGTPTVEAYDRSAHGTISAGRRFTYRDPDANEPRVGYFDARGNRLTVLTDDEIAIVTHFACPDRYARRLPDSDYRRS
jgi:hypothetical protein